jgi:ribosomal protein S18 acetylase RimI-like enzyme
MLDKLEEIARSKGCCKLCLEVLEGNVRAQKVYKSFGFASYQLDPSMGKALFWNKKLI